MNAVQKARERMPLTYVRISLRRKFHNMCNRRNSRTENYRGSDPVAVQEATTTPGYRPKALLYCGSTRQTAHTTSMAALLMLAATQPRQC